MKNFIIRRLILGVFIVFFGGAMITYSVIRSLPTSYVEGIARQRASNPLSTKSYQEWLDQLNQVYGLDKGIIPGFLDWVKNALRGEFGESWHYGVPVTEKFNDVIWISFSKYYYVISTILYSNTIRYLSGKETVFAY